MALVGGKIQIRTIYHLLYFEKDLRETSTGCDFYTIMALIQVSIL